MKKQGYVAAVVGSLIGSFCLAWAIGFVAAWLEMRAKPGEGLAGLAGAVIGGLSGAGLGAGLGAWLALRKKHRRPLVTAIGAAIVAPASIVGGLYGSYAVLFDYFGRVGAPLGFRGASIIVVAVTFVTGVTVVRFAVLRVPSAYRP